MLLKLDHVQLAMPVAGEPAARKFYADTLGLNEVTKPENLAKRGGCWFEKGSVKLHLGVMREFQPATKAHPAFIVADLQELRHRLQAAGYLCTDDEPLAGFNRTYVADPFGNRIELMQPLEAT
ncbi:VOC family protein [Polycladidibacter hongkongensis]|uniref:VOC family protein n=1 Tax=Polycladidibacter hongkongensis TaxID=1647556 RepID=UPI00082F41D0|nr:VOC family protein [Pseudovibrio hongkongensis]